ncbi:MAG: DUF6361 family protein [Alcanivoracaceae bacterium]|nr:DUF6361 family protein [Alcanivoracaceae bacterium]
MSSIGWVDFSPDDRNKVRTVLAMLSEPGTLDELGIGQVRDAFSDLLFPGFSTIQTRAKYFVIIPRILRDYQALTAFDQNKNPSALKYLNAHEDMVAELLDANHDEGELGIIGRTRVGQGGVERRPSVIYWNGLRVLQLVKTPLSLADFCRKLSSGERSSFDDSLLGEEDDVDALKDRNVISIPNHDPSWKESDLSLSLTCKEALFLVNRFIRVQAVQDSIPSQLFRHNLIDNALVEAPNQRINNFDILAEILLTSDKVTEACKENVYQASQFSLAMEGPHIRYNILLASQCREAAKVVELESEFADWVKEVREKRVFEKGCADEWLGKAAIGGKRNIKPQTQDFIRKVSGQGVAGDFSELNRLVKQQALINKGDRSLLRKQTKYDGWVGLRRLEYRWGTARILLSDINEGISHAEA